MSSIGKHVKQEWTFNNISTETYAQQQLLCQMDPNVTCSFAGRTFELFCYLETLEASHIYEEKSNVFNYTRQSAMCSCINIGITNCSSRFNTNQGLPHNFCFGQFRNWHKFICWRIPSAKKKKNMKTFFLCSCVPLFCKQASLKGSL